MGEQHMVNEVDVVAIHGMNMHRAQRSEMQRTWHAAMAEGLANIRSAHASTLTVECAFYGHEYNDGKAGGEPRYSRIDIRPGFEEELLIAIGDALEEADGEADEPTKFHLPGKVQRALAAIERQELFEGRDSRAISYVKQVDRYLTDPDFRKVVHAEVTTAMRRSPRVVVAHSLGSVVAYDWLRENRPERPPALITIGSPLGLAAIRRRVNAPGWPGNTRTWTNIAAAHDAVAMVKELAPLYSPDIRDLPCDNPRKEAHSAVQYLTNVHTSRAVEAALA
ncbi:hypothetical protein [Streptomyces fulvoviolaceus]|uniref:hypothetical protein n=1 Tax=Streptomyces fulvoviolaceus TaxID=285535 RepID=UPI000693A173|nr:hypothetical protein [Streptomyces fulvoviolaceus]MCT9075079.1 hypothetical protein [Streptomyces fulvoviolaceus]